MPSSTARLAVGDRRISSWRSPNMAAIGASRFTDFRRRRRRVGLAMLVAAHPLHFGPQQDDLAENEEDAEQQHAQDHAVEDRCVAEHAQEVLVQREGEARHGGEEHQHANEVGKGTAHALWIMTVSMCGIWGAIAASARRCDRRCRRAATRTGGARVRRSRRNHACPNVGRATHSNRRAWHDHLAFNALRPPCERAAEHRGPWPNNSQ